MNKGYDPYNHNPFTDNHNRDSRSEHWANREMQEAARRGFDFDEWLEILDPHGELDRSNYD